MAFRFRATPKKIEKGTYAPAKYKFPKWQWYFLSLLIASPLIYILATWLLGFIITYAPAYISMNTLTIRAPSDGYVRDISVHLGDKTIQNVPLLLIDSPTMLQRKTYLENELKQLQYREHNSLNDPELPNLLKMQQIAKQQRDENRDYYQKLLTLEKSGLVTVIDLSRFGNRYYDAQLNYQNIKAKIAKSQQDYQDYLEKTYHEPISLLQEELSQINIENGFLQILTPASGSVITILVHSQEFVLKGQALLKLSIDKQLFVTALFDAKNVDSLVPGKKVHILLPNYKLITGVIRTHPDFTSANTETLFDIQPLNHKLVTLIDFTEPLPEKYLVSDLKVWVFF